MHNLKYYSVHVYAIVQYSLNYNYHAAAAAAAAAKCAVSTTATNAKVLHAVKWSLCKLQW
jgi:hypothetical protein